MLSPCADDGFSCMQTFACANVCRVKKKIAYSFRSLQAHQPPESPRTRAIAVYDPRAGDRPTTPQREKDRKINNLELYHYDHSTAAQKVRIALAEKQLEWTSHHLDTSVAKREHFSEEYLKINPRGIVPTLVHDGKAIRESQVILEYLDDAFPEHPLRPEGAYEKAQMRLWTKLIDEGLHVHSRVVGMCIVVRHAKASAGPEVLEQYLNEMPEVVRKSNDRVNIAQGLDSPLLPAAVAYFKKVFEDMDAALAESPWLAGDTFSLADISLGVYVTRLKSFQMAPLWDNLTHLLEWYERFISRDSYADGVTKWGDKTTAKRKQHGDEAFDKVRELWNAA